MRNISNCLSIRTEFERCSQGLRECAKQRGYWDGRGKFDWAAAFSDGGSPPLGQLSSGREVNGHRLLQAAAGALDPRAMMHILRDSSSGICMCGGGGFRSNGAQVSWLVPPGCDDRQQQQQAQHWFTATPDPQRSIFKPFSFSFHQGQQQDGQPGCSPHTAAAPAPRNPPHALWRAWQAVYEARAIGKASKPSQAALRELEARGLEGATGISFAAAVEEEMRLYGAAAAAAAR